MDLKPYFSYKGERVNNKKRGKIMCHVKETVEQVSVKLPSKRNQVSGLGRQVSRLGRQVITFILALEDVGKTVGPVV